MNSTRRGFLGSAATAAFFASTPGLAHSLRPKKSAESPPSDAWTTKLGRYRTVFDFTDLDSVPGIQGVARLMNAYRSELGLPDSELGIVVVIRHRAIPVVIGKNSWQKFSIARDILHLGIPLSQASANPFQSEIERLQRRGVVLLACGVALKQLAGEISSMRSAGMRSVVDALQHDLITGVQVLPNGLYALARAQDVGCGVIS